MFGQSSIAPFVIACAGVLTLASACGSPAPSVDASSAPQPADPNAPVASGAPLSVPSGALPVTPSPATSSAPTSGPNSAEPARSASAESPGLEVVDYEAEQAILAARATGPATGGPRGTRPCAFHESVDSYQRQCVAKVNPDGSVTVTAKGTKLNPDNGFEFTFHGGENHQWVAKGTLNAFAKCAGPFAALVTSSLDQGVNTYELRFKQHCKIVVR